MTTVITLVVVSLYIFGTVEKSLYNQHRMTVMSRANVIAGIIAQNEFETLDTNIERLLKQANISLNPEAGDRLYAINGDARVVYDTNETPAALTGRFLITESVIKALHGESDYHLNRYEDGDVFTAVAVPIEGSGALKGVVLLNVSAAGITTQMQSMRVSLFWIAGAACLAVLLISFFVGGLIARPIRLLVKNIHEVSKSGFRTKLPIKNRRGEVGELAEEVDHMVDELKTLEDKRREFVSNASHELKTPLSAIKLVCDSLLNSEYDPELSKEFLQDMNNEVDRLTEIVSGLLTLTKMDNDSAQKPPMVTQNLREVIDGVVASLQPLAKQRGIELTFETENDVFMMMDRNKIWEAIYNIVDNSIKYTEEGSVSTYLERSGEYAVVTVRDTGVGIDKEEIGKIFERFYRVDPARSRETGGTGLGLSIALKAVESHGGHIEVESERGKGSVFRIYFPVV